MVKESVEARARSKRSITKGQIWLVKKLDPFRPVFEIFVCNPVIRVYPDACSCNFFIPFLLSTLFDVKSGNHDIKGSQFG